MVVRYKPAAEDACKTRFDVVVIGGGHAGCEAAAAAARMGARTALVTHRFATIGAMSCNPAIGGLGKGHLVREIDALDGLMGRVADQGGIQFRVLNQRKGPAVRGPRAQADRKLYAAAMQEAIRQTPNLQVIEAEADDLLSANGRVIAASNLWTAARSAAAPSFSPPALSSAASFTSAKSKFQPAASAKPRPSGLSRTLENIGFALGRLKTGTPPRLDGRSIDWASLEMQPGDDPPEPFSMLTTRIDNPQIRCGITRTSEATHKIIRDNVHRSPMYSGQIASRGPRYCPSIEDKIVKFGERDGHQIFLEPEGLDDHTVYPNGISTSLPEDVQHALVATIRGLEKATVRSPWLRHRIRLRRSARTQGDAGNKKTARICFSPDRSTAPQVTKRLRHRDFLQVSMRRHAPARARNYFRSCAGLHRRDDRRSGHARSQRAVSHVYFARRISAWPCAPTMPISV